MIEFLSRLLVPAGVAVDAGLLVTLGPIRSDKSLVVGAVLFDCSAWFWVDPLSSTSTELGVAAGVFRKSTGKSELLFVASLELVESMIGPKLNKSSWFSDCGTGFVDANTRKVWIDYL